MWKIRIEALNNELDNYTAIFDRYAEKYGIYQGSRYGALDSIAELIARQSLRITVIDANGRVGYDSEVNDPSSMENHAQRKEVRTAMDIGHGTDVRVSRTTARNTIMQNVTATALSGASVVYDIVQRNSCNPTGYFWCF
jgi:hypothetical protein